MDNYIPLKEYGKQMGIKTGDIVFISSDAKIMLLDALRNKSSKDLNDFIDGLIEVVGENGTIFFPTYNWGFCKGDTFDYHSTACETGALGTVALHRGDFKRTKHPIYSFAVYGKDKEYLVGLDNKDSFGLDSPFNYFKEKNVINYIIDVSLQHSFTFTHFAEEHSGVVEHRFIKEFSSQYIDERGIESTRVYSMFVRRLDMDVRTLIDPIEEDYIQNKAGHRFSINNSNILRVELGKAYPILLNDIEYNRSRKLCSYKGQE